METSVSPRERQVLDVLVTLPQQADFPTIAEAVETRLNLTSSNTAAILDKLRKKNLIGREGTRRNYTYFVQVPSAKTEAPRKKAVPAQKPVAVPAITRKPEVAPTPAPAVKPSAPARYDMSDPASVRALIEALLDRIEALTTEVVELRAEKAKFETQSQMDYLTPNLADRLHAIGFEIGTAV